MTLNCLIIKCFRCHLSFAIFAFTLSLLHCVIKDLLEEFVGRIENFFLIFVFCCNFLIFAQNILLLPIHYEELQRVEQLEVPKKALRELVYNSVAHKDYTGHAILMRI